jgi:hypothetical protein
MAELITGGCECGALRYECAAVPLMAAHCHCRSCRKSGGTGHGSHLMVPRAAVTISGEARFYERPADSGSKVRRAFCPTCGSPVYGETSGFPDVLVLRAGSLDDPEQFRPGARVYAAQAPAWDHMDPALRSFPGMPER